MLDAHAPRVAVSLRESDGFAKAIIASCVSPSRVVKAASPLRSAAALQI